MRELDFCHGQKIQLKRAFLRIIGTTPEQKNVKTEKAGGRRKGKENESLKREEENRLESETGSLNKNL